VDSWTSAVVEKERGRRRKMPPEANFADITSDGEILDGKENWNSRRTGCILAVLSRVKDQPEMLMVVGDCRVEC